MNGPGWKAALVTGALGMASCTAWIGVAPVAGASPGGHRTVVHSVVSERSGGLKNLPARARSLLRHRLPDPLRPATGGSGGVVDGRAGVGGGVRVASNWSGEVERGSNLTSVSATWTVPSVVASTSLAFAATWVGIGGYSGTTLIQTGTIEATETRQVGYTAWVEVLPELPWTLTSAASPGGSASFVVAPGNVMEASVTATGTGDLWQVTVSDTTAKWTYAHIFGYPVTATSAEWITERPSLITSITRKTMLATLADYGSTRFSDIESADGGAVAAPAPSSLTAIRMESDGNVISSPGPVSATTVESFTDSYLTVPTRVYGQTVDDTAAAELEHQFTYHAGSCPSSPTSGRAVVLATDKTYADALASGYLASYLGTGTLLTAPTSLSVTTLSAIQDEGITHVYVVGGPLAVSTAVVSVLESTPAYTCGGTTTLPGTVKVDVTRVAGDTEYDTALDIAETAGATPGRVDLSGAYAGVNALGGDGAYNLTAGDASTSAPAGALTTAILATGDGFQDAEAASTLAYAEHLPILLTTPSALSAQVLSAIETLHIQQVVVMGGQLAVSDAVVQTLEAHGVSVLRVAGADYTETAIELAECELGTAASHAGVGWAPTGMLTVARGDFYSDGLAGAVVAADGPTDTHPEPLVLTATPTSMGSYLPAFLAEAGTTGLGGRRITTFTILGGPFALSQALVNTMVVALLG